MTITAPIILAAAPHFIETLGYLSGFLITMLTLVAMWLITASIGQYFVRLEKRSQVVNVPQKPKEVAASPSPAPAEQSMSPQLIAVVAAAVHVTLGKVPHQIVSIKPADPSWSREGRRQIFDSHRVR